jgi:regulator of RNase E activity RraA
VNPGDVVLADDDGVVFAAPSQIEAARANIAAVRANEDRLEDPEALSAAMRKLVVGVVIDRT